MKVCLDDIVELLEMISETNSLIIMSLSKCYKENNNKDVLEVAGKLSFINVDIEQYISSYNQGFIDEDDNEELNDLLDNIASILDEVKQFKISEEVIKSIFQCLKKIR